MIRVVAIITAQPGRREELLTAFRALVPLVHAEQGCIEYQPTIDAEG
jgi:quinol monooxygenase YgiN